MVNYCSRDCFLITLALTLSIGVVYADTKEDGGYWFNVHMQGKLPVQNFHWSMDTNPRYRNEGKHIDYLYLRPSIFYALNPKTTLWLGHDTIIGHPDGKSAYHENRWWEQFQYQFDPISTVSFTNRTRLEERTREGFHDNGHRLRQMIKVSIPMDNRQKLSLVISDELFINFNQTDWGARRGIDQNRFFIGANWKFNRTSYLEAGYLNQLVNKPMVNLDNHVITATLGFKF